MKKTKQNFLHSRWFRRSDRNLLLLVLAFVTALGVTFSLVSFGKRANDEMKSPLSSKSAFEMKIQALVAGHPIERMVPYIATRDQQVATYLVAIAKKESNWGKFSPQKNGKNCYNYWGYRGPEDTTDSGYSCFASPGEAVMTVAARLRELLDQGLDTPRKLVVWKRGFLGTPLDSSEEKWVADVGYYVSKMSNDQ